MIPQLRPFLDERGRLAALPAKYRKRLLAIRYLAEKLEAGRTYTQEELGEVLDRWHTFHDPATLRRSMADLGLVDRAADGSVYRRAEELPEPEAFIAAQL